MKQSFDIPKAPPAEAPMVPDATMERSRIREILVREAEVDAARAGGKGGQNVNKVSSKAVIVWHPNKSDGFTEEQKSMIIEKLANEITEGGYIRRTCSDGRDFHRNKETAFDRLAETIQKALHKPKERLETEVPQAADAGRVSDKRKLGDLKRQRGERFSPSSE